MVKGHPMWRLLARKPNPEMIPFEFGKPSLRWLPCGGMVMPKSNAPTAAYQSPSGRSNPGEYRPDVERTANSITSSMERPSLSRDRCLRIGGFWEQWHRRLHDGTARQDSFGLAMAAERFACRSMGMARAQVDGLRRGKIVAPGPKEPS